MTNYLKHKPGSIEEVIANQTSKFREDSGYQKMFRKELDKAGKGIGSMSPAEKKAFFNKIDKKYTAKDEDLNSKDKPAVKKIITKLKGASQAHGQQAKDLEKAVSEEKDCGPGMYYCKASGTCKPLSMKKEAVMPDDKGEKINQMKHQLAKKGEKKPFDQLRKETKLIRLGDNGKTATGQKAAVIDVEPSAKPI